MCLSVAANCGTHTALTSLDSICRSFCLGVEWCAAVVMQCDSPCCSGSWLCKLLRCWECGICLFGCDTFVNEHVLLLQDTFHTQLLLSAQMLGWDAAWSVDSIGGV